MLNFISGVVYATEGKILKSMRQFFFSEGRKNSKTARYINMSRIRNDFKLIIEILYIIFAIYGGLLSLAIILSWVPGIYDASLFSMSENSRLVFGPFRGRLVISTIDLSPMIGLIIMVSS